MESKPVTKTKTQRSSSYPSIGLEEAIKGTKTLRDSLGRGPYSREMASEALGHAKISGTAAAKIAAMAYFGLLIRTGNVYSQSPLAERIFLKVSEEDKLSAIREAAKTPKLYRELIDKYSGSSLPSLLNNILAREFGINEKVSRHVAELFSTSLEYAGLLKNGVVHSDGSPPSENLEKPSIDKLSKKPSDREAEKNSGTLVVEVGLDNNEVGKIEIPNRVLSEKEAAKMKAQVNILAEIFNEAG